MSGFRSGPVERIAHNDSSDKESHKDSTPTVSRYEGMQKRLFLMCRGNDRRDRSKSRATPADV